MIQDDLIFNAILFQETKQTQKQKNVARNTVTEHRSEHEKNNNVGGSQSGEGCGN